MMIENPVLFLGGPYHGKSMMVPPEEMINNTLRIPILENRANVASYNSSPISDSMKVAEYELETWANDKPAIDHYVFRYRGTR